jgi:hypothetical protein
VPERVVFRTLAKSGAEILDLVRAEQHFLHQYAVKLVSFSVLHLRAHLRARFNGVVCKCSRQVPLTTALGLLSFSPTEYTEPRREQHSVRLNQSKTENPKSGPGLLFESGQALRSEGEMSRAREKGRGHLFRTSRSLFGVKCPGPTHTDEGCGESTNL